MKTLALKSGLTLSYSEFGDTSGKESILFCHGFPGTGEEAGIAHKFALDHNIRIIAPTRPGIGFSEYEPQRSILSWVTLVEELLEVLQISQFHLLGISGGTPYALACLKLLPNRVKRCLIVSGMGPPLSVDFSVKMSFMSRVPLWCAYRLPRLSESLITLISLATKLSPHGLLQVYQFCMSKDDQRILRRSKIAEKLLANIQSALRQGTQGIRHDFRLMTSDWGFDLAKIDSKVTLFHGDDDQLVPVGIAQANARLLSNSNLEIFPGKGHFMAFEIIDQIINYFLERPANSTNDTLPQVAT